MQNSTLTTCLNNVSDYIAATDFCATYASASNAIAASGFGFVLMLAAAVIIAGAIATYAAR